MRINYSYQYQDFPGADGLTSISMLIGKLTSAPWVVFYTVIIYAILGGNTDLEFRKGFFGVIITILIPLLVYFILKIIRTKSGEILQKKYIAKLNALKDNNPAEYYQIMLELQKRQAGN